MAPELSPEPSPRVSSGLLRFHFGQGIESAREIYVDDRLAHLNRQRLPFRGWIIISGLLTLSLSVHGRQRSP